MSQLTANEKHLLRLARQGQNAEGWAKVSKVIWPFMATLPSELVELKPNYDGGLVKLTTAGNTLLDWL